MLSKEDKNRIILEEKYRLEVNSQMNSKKINHFEKSIKIIQSVAIIVGIIFSYLEYVRYNNEKIEREKERIAQTAKEIRMEFYKLQLEYYAEATEAASTLATEDKTSDDYLIARKKFFRLFWGRLAIVEEKTVEAEMINFKEALEKYENSNINTSKKDLEAASLRLAHMASRYTINEWVDSIERINYNRR